MSHSWLQRKRKGELVELAQRANLPGADGYLKDDLVDALEQHLAANETTYGKVSDFSDFYARSGSPVKRERVSSSPGLAVAKTRRRQTIVKNIESEEPTPDKPTTTTTSSSLIARTPRAIARRVTEVDIPASPAQLAEVADQSFQVAKTKASELWTKTRIDELKEFLRENASSVAAIQTFFLLVEAVGLQWNTLQTTPAFSVPAAAAQYSNSQYVSLPDLSALLTSDWWAPATLWSLTSWLLPLILSYFFNLTLRSNTHRKSSDRVYTVDPFTFHIAKAILSYSAYRLPMIDPAVVGEPGIARAVDLSWGPFSESSVGVVRQNVPGGYYGLQIGAAVGILVSLYDAALKK